MRERKREYMYVRKGDGDFIYFREGERVSV